MTRPRGAGALLDSFRDYESGRLGRPAQLGELNVPEQVALNDGLLWFTWGAEPRTVPVPDDLLERFLLAGSDSAILALATKLGPLCFDATGVVGLQIQREAWPLGALSGTIDLLSWWHGTRRQFQALLRLAISLRESDQPDAKAIEELGQLGMRFGHTELLEKASSHKHRPENVRLVAELDLVNHISALVGICGLAPVLRVSNWGKRHAQFELAFQDWLVTWNWVGLAHSRDDRIPRVGVSLFGALLVKLLSAISGSGFSSCSECGDVYVPKRKPRAGEAHYCSKCGREAAVRAAGVRYRERRLAQAKEKKQ